MKPYFETKLGKLYNGDCLTIMPELEPVDLVLKNILTNKTKCENIKHEEKQEGFIQNGSGKGIVGAKKGRDQVALSRTKMAYGENSELFQDFSGGNEQGNPAIKNQIKRKGQTGKREREIQRREPELPLSSNDREGQMLDMQENNGACSSPQKRGSLRQPTGKSSNTLWELSQPLPQKTMVGKAEIICLTDPPYGIKRDKGFEGFGGFGTPIKRRRFEDDNWDSKRPDKIVFDKILSISELALIFGGNFFADILPQSTHWIVWDKKNTMPTFGDAELIWTNSKRKSIKIIEHTYNGLIGKEKTRYHPAQKPAQLFIQIILKYSKEGQIIFDPFLGSGTTGKMAELNNRRWIGIEISEKYCEIAAKRIEKENQQLKLF